MKAVTGLPKLPPGASGELLESDLLESADDIPAMKAPPFVEEVVELEPAPKKNVVELPPPHPAATPVDEPRRAKPPTDRAPRSRSGTAPVDPLPAGTFTYPTRKRRSLVPLAIALMLLAALAGAGIVLFLNRSKKQEPAKKDPIAQAPNTIDAAQVAALDAGMPAPDIDAAEIEVVVESPDAAVATRPPKPPRTPPDAAPRIATAPIDAAPRIETAPIDAAPRRPDPPPDAAVAVVAPPVDAAPPPVVVADGCDETTCVMENYAKPCCARWKPNTVGNFGQTLEKSQIRAGISGVKAAIVACGEKSSAKGTVTVSVTVSPDGAVTGVSVASSPDGQLGACVAAAVRRASFAKTARGGSFNYPFVF
jgi:TonB family protein